MKYAFVLFLLFTGVKAVYPQDKIFLRNDSIVSGKIIYADSLLVKIRLPVRPDGPDYILYKDEITKIQYESGTNIFYKYKYFENSIGVSGSFYGNSSQTSSSPSLEHVGEFTYLNISGKYPGINYYVRNAILGIKIGIGYGKINLITEKTISYGVHHGTIYENVYDTTDTDKFNLAFSFRFNGTANRKINPFFSISTIIQDVSIIYLVGGGIQWRINKKYFIETEFSAGFWNGYYEDPENYILGNELIHFSIGIYRILSSKYTNGK